jgi:uncharacterized protein
LTRCGVSRSQASCSRTCSPFSGYFLLSEEQQAALPGGAANGLVGMLANVFVNDKFITIFSLLFGLGFGIQLARARARGVDVVPTYSRRLLVLLVIGLAHKFALWGGDILTLYAVFGFGLLLVRDWSDRQLLLAGLTIALTAIPIDALLKHVTGTPPIPWPAGWAAQRLAGRVTTGDAAAGAQVLYGRC